MLPARDIRTLHSRHDYQVRLVEYLRRSFGWIIRPPWARNGSVFDGQLASDTSRAHLRAGQAEYLGHDTEFEVHSPSTNSGRPWPGQDWHDLYVHLVITPMATAAGLGEMQAKGGLQCRHRFSGAPRRPVQPRAAFASRFTFETDCWDVHDALSKGADFILLDVRNPALFARGHVRCAINLPHGRIIASKMDMAFRPAVRHLLRRPPLQRRGARRASTCRLGRPVKIMAGGVTGWLDEGFALESGQ